MSKLNISQAARAVGISRKTMQAHIKKSKVSWELDDKGNKVIDTSELIRVYGEIKHEGVTPTSHEKNPSITHHYTPEVTHLYDEKISMLEQQIEAMKEDREERKQREEKLQQEKDELLAIIKQQNLLLEDKREQKGFWSRLFGR